MADTATDLVISYTVHATGKLENYEPLKKALDEGYLVVDVIPTPVTSGGSAVGFGSVVVTVVLHKIGGKNSVYRGTS